LLLFLTTLIGLLFLFLLKLCKASSLFLSFDGIFSGFLFLLYLALLSVLDQLLGFTLLLFSQGLSLDVSFLNTIFKSLALHLLAFLLF